MSGPVTFGGRLSSVLERNVFVVLMLGACCALQAVVVRITVVSDAWYTLLGGRSIVSSGLPGRDTLTVLTLGRHWVDQQWLAQLDLYSIWRAGGWQLATLAVLVLYAGAFLVGAAAARRFGASDRNVAVILAVCFVAGLSNTVYRAQIPAYLLFELVLVLLLADVRRGTRRVYLVIPLLVLWANIHGSVVLGAALVTLRGLVALGGGLRRREAASAWLPKAAALSVVPWACTLASPYAFELPGYYRSVFENPTLSNSVSEWAESTVRGEPVFFLLFILAIWLAGRAGSVLDLFSKLALTGCGLLGLLAVRNIVWFALAAAVILPAALDAAWRPSDVPRRPRFNLLLAVAGVAAAIYGAGFVALRGRSWFESGYPPGAVAAVSKAARTDASLRVFATETFADWLLFEDPSLAGRVAYDVRFELLPRAQLDRIVAFRNESGLDWDRVADGYRVLVLGPGDDAGAVKTFRAEGATVLFKSSKIIVLLRKLQHGP